MTFIFYFDYLAFDKRSLTRIQTITFSVQVYKFRIVPRTVHLELKTHNKFSRDKILKFLIGNAMRVVVPIGMLKLCEQRNTV